MPMGQEQGTAGTSYTDSGWQWLTWEAEALNAHLDTLTHLIDEVLEKDLEWNL